MKLDVGSTLSYACCRLVFTFSSLNAKPSELPSFCAFVSLQFPIEKRTDRKLNENTER